MTCECKNAGFCQRYNTEVSNRDIQCCQGTSGLSPNKEAYYLEQLAKRGRGELQAPSLITQMVSIAKAAANFITSGFETVPEERYKERGQICEKCPHLTKTKQCEICNCFVSLKAKLPGQDCPKGFWPKLEQNNINAVGEAQNVETPPKENPPGGCGCGN